MRVRRATIRDYEDIKRLMIDFANNNPVEDLQSPEYSDMHVNRLLDHLTKEGISLVCEKEGKVIGMLLASIQGDIWLPHIKRMTEIAWWVETEYRGTTAGARLLHEYITLGKKLTDNKVISSFTLTTLANTPDLKLQERGWESIDYNWVYRG